MQSTDLSIDMTPTPTLARQMSVCPTCRRSRTGSCAFHVIAFKLAFSDDCGGESARTFDRGA